MPVVWVPNALAFIDSCGSGRVGGGGEEGFILFLNKTAKVIHNCFLLLRLSNLSGAGTSLVAPDPVGSASVCLIRTGICIHF
jgi:hypothetical protein